MKTGDPVTATDASGEDHRGEVMDVVGTGKSWYKRLDLKVGDETWKDVAHLNDAKGGEPYWRESGTPGDRPAPHVGTDLRPTPKLGEVAQELVEAKARAKTERTEAKTEPPPKKK